MGHVLMENRNSLVIDTRVAQANGTAEREAAVEMIEHIPGCRQIIVGADKVYDTDDFVDRCRGCKATACVACCSEAIGIRHR